MVRGVKMDGTTAVTRRRGAQDTRRLLLAAASALFAERGYERATVRDIAERAGVNQALLFRYFGSKQALFAEVMTHGGHEQLRTTAPEQLFEVALRGILAPKGGSAGPGPDEADRPLATFLRSIGSDDTSAVVHNLNEEYAKVLATLSAADDSGLRADLALSWLLGIGLMRVVVAKEPLASADPDTVCKLVLDTLGTLLEDLPAPDA